MQYGKLGASKPHQVGIHNSPFLTAGRVKNRYHCPWLVCLSGVLLLYSFFQLRCSAKEKLKMEFLFPSEREGKREREPTSSLFKFYVFLLPCGMSHEQFDAELFLTVKPGATMGRSEPCRELKASESRPFTFSSSLTKYVCYYKLRYICTDCQFYK